MACGKPTICFEGTALPEVVFTPQAGLAVPSRDSAALAAAMERLIGDPQERLARKTVNAMACHRPRIVQRPQRGLVGRHRRQRLHAQKTRMDDVV
ncbi:glycosyltransferase, partial [Paenibacillus polymyxa]|nr:glycosyltransferase [Paenibacillus polymyxa]